MAGPNSHSFLEAAFCLYTIQVSVALACICEHSHARIRTSRIRVPKVCNNAMLSRAATSI